MRLMTEELEKVLAKYPIGSQEELGEYANVLAKYFNPTGRGTWYVTEAEKQEDGDWLFYGYAHLFEGEWGYTLLSELENVRLPFGLKIERDLHLNGGRIRDYI